MSSNQHEFKQCPCEAGGVIHSALFGDPAKSGDSGMRGELAMVRNKLNIIEKIGWAVLAMVGLAVVKMILASAGIDSRQAPVQQQNQSITVPDSDEPGTQRAYLTPEDVAERESVNADTVRRWIAEGRIEPPPVQDAPRGPWAIDTQYRVLPASSRASSVLE